MADFVAKFIGFVVLLAVMALIATLPTYWLWNWLVPDITRGALTGVTFWQAFGVILLTSILFKSSSPSSSSKD